MRSLHYVALGLSTFILAGCGSTKETAELKVPSGVITEELSPPPTENSEKVVVENFSIQIGAFEKEENALQFAFNAKNLLKEDIYNIYDRANLIYRVMIGRFNSKDAATEFRDQFVKKFPDYNKAWVIDVNNEVTR